MTRASIFGTDGVRGQANSFPMTAEVALRLAMAVGRHFRRGDHRHRVIVGKDTRRSNYMIETALTSGLASMGMDVYLLGPLQTPGVAMLTRTLRADLGIMITASHNQFADNGIKLIGPDGYKLSDTVEMEIEQLMAATTEAHLATPQDIGHVQRLDDGGARYIEFAKATFPRRLRLDGLTIVIDCANGAAYRTAPAVLWELGAEVCQLGVEPNGFNINENCGSTAPERARTLVLESGADLGIALDGDADRVQLIDEAGRLIDGDLILATIAGRMVDQQQLRGGCVVATIMSNLGLQHYLAARGITVEQTQVGDRYVIARMRERQCNLGGEQSGHVVLRDYVTTGDGTIAALQVLAAMVESGRPASEICHPFEPVPQLVRSVQSKAAVLEDQAVQSAIADANAQLGSNGRVVVRPSGTEPLVRVMVEGHDSGELEILMAGLCDHLTDAATRVDGP